MGLKVLAKSAKEKQIVLPSLTIDLSKHLGEGATAKFRAPEVADFFPSDKDKLTFAATYPKLKEQTQLILIMATCYIPDEDENDLLPADALAELATNGRDAFLYVMKAFNKAFPVVTFDKLVEETKNA